VDPWCVREPALDPAGAGAAASVLGLANGYVGVRGVLEEGRPGAGPGTLLAPVYEVRPHTYAEPAYGYPECDERVVAVPDGWGVDVAVDGHPFHTGSGHLTAHRRTLDLRAGVLDRELRWTAPSGGTVEITTRRLVSFERRELVVTALELTAVDAVRVDLRPFRCRPAEPEDPAGEPALQREVCHHGTDDAWTLQHVPSSAARLLVAADFLLDPPAGAAVERRTSPHGSTLALDLAAGDRVRLLLPVAYVAGAAAPQVQLHDRAREVLDAARVAGWDALQAEQRAFLDDVWDRADVEVDGDDELQQAVRFGVFQAVQASACADGVGIRAKGLTGDGYHGHTFWDADTFVVPVLNHALPRAAAAHLRWRHSTLPQAVARAREVHLDGAAFAWRTISGRECSGYWPAGTAAFHITADVADAAVRHAAATLDDAFAAEVALDLAVHAARLWVSLGHHDRGAFHIDGVTGPDEYSALGDDNTYTNLMARRNLRAAVGLATRFPHGAAALGVTDDEVARWTAAADAMAVPSDPVLGVTPQAQRWTTQARWDFTATGADDYPLDQSVTYERLYRHQVVKQADLVLALYLAPDAFDAAQKRRDLEYYEPLTVRDSSLSAPAQAVVAAEVGHLGLAWRYARETALIDLRDLDGTTAEGVHVAALAGAWTALVAGFGGVRDHDGGLHLAPRLPPALTRLRFRLLRGGSLLDVEVRRDRVAYRLLRGADLDLTHAGEPLRLSAADPVVERVLAPAPDLAPPPPQPPHRAPLAGDGPSMPHDTRRRGSLGP
jgi:alpha,alpha-trehalose phosphorylase/kojibiose phosphorylase